MYQSYYVTPYVKYMTSLKVVGVENIKGERPYIFVANHTSNLDTPIMIAAIPAKIRNQTVVAGAMDTFFMSRVSAFRAVLRFNVIPIDRHKVNRRSSQLAIEVLEDKWNLLLFPEGGRTKDGNLQEFKGGAAYLAQRTNSTIIPIYIHDIGFLRGPKYAKAPKYINAPSNSRHPVTVAFGKPLKCGDGENIRKFNNRIEDAVVALGREISGDLAYSVSRPSENLES
jgi:1-acyl-sn-glycerol-3-phosphate acyltransferase